MRPFFVLPRPSHAPLPPPPREPLSFDARPPGRWRRQASGRPRALPARVRREAVIGWRAVAGPLRHPCQQPPMNAACTPCLHMQSFSILPLSSLYLFQHCYTFYTHAPLHSSGHAVSSPAARITMGFCGRSPRAVGEFSICGRAREMMGWRDGLVSLALVACMAGARFRPCPGAACSHAASPSAPHRTPPAPSQTQRAGRPVVERCWDREGCKQAVVCCGWAPGAGAPPACLTTRPAAAARRMRGSPSARTSQGVGTVVMKNWLPLVLGPALAMLSRPGRSWRSEKLSSLKVRPAVGGWGGGWGARGAGMGGELCSWPVEWWAVWVIGLSSAARHPCLPHYCPCWLARAAAAARRARCMPAGCSTRAP